MSTARLARRRSNLMKQRPFCHWCGRKLIYFKKEPGTRTPEDFATIDHINSRLMHPDGRPLIGKQVLACPGCNQDRNRQEELALGIEEIRRRSGRGVYVQTNSASIMSSSDKEFSIPAAQSGERREPIALARSENKALARSI